MVTYKNIFFNEKFLNIWVSVWETFFTKVAFGSIVQIKITAYNLSIKRGDIGMNEINIGKNITKFRRNKGITQDELANYIGVSKSSVSKVSRNPLNSNSKIAFKFDEHIHDA